MLEFIYKPLPDRDAYLRRMGYAGSTEPTLENLHTLIHTHQMTVPYENLDCCVTHEPISLEVDRLFDKIVTRNRGGYCFELNGLFLALLLALGYDARSVPCRVSSNFTELRSINHRGNIVRLDGKEYFCDVGMGGAMPPFAVELSPRRQTMFGETYWVENIEMGWYLLRRISGRGFNDDGTDRGVEKNVTAFGPLAMLAEDFEAYSYQFWAMPDSSFISRGVSVSLRTAAGYRSLKQDTLVTRDGDEITERPVPREEIPAVLDRYFGIRL